MRFLLLLLLVACGPLPVEPEVTSPLVGGYKASYWVQDAVGSCSFLPEGGSGDLAFTEEGQLKSPFPGVDCSVSYIPGALDIVCKGYGSRLDAHGFRSESDGWVYGTADFKGNVGGCTGVSLSFQFRPLVSP